MQQGYFRRVAETGTRFWINNPTLDEADKALAAGAIDCTTNPSFCSRLLDVEPAAVRELIDGVIVEVANDDVAAEKVYGLAAQLVMKRFLPLYESSGHEQGFVTVQGDPRRDDDSDHIVLEALRFAELGPNFMAKIPVTEAGSAAISALVDRGIPICATEVFCLDQAIYICEAYERAASAAGKRPPFFVTHITGIFDEYLQGYVRRQGVAIAPEVLGQAGWAVAHEEYRLHKDRRYPGALLGGGARGLHHFTDMVGGDMHVTINWSTARDLLEADAPATPKIQEVPASEVVEELSAKLPDFRRAYTVGGLAPAEFKDFGPLLHFRSSFLRGWNRLVDEIRVRRAGVPGAGRTAGASEIRRV
jgi:transaldolase